jgi:hypothetical protein
MGLFDRVKSTTTPDEGLAQLKQSLASEAGRLWLPLYSDDARIKDVFVQRAPNVVEMVTGGEFTIDVGGGFMSFASVRGGRKTVANQKVEITPLLQTLILKEGALDLTGHEAAASDTLLEYVGPGRFVMPGEGVPAVPEFDVTPELARAIQEQRGKHEEMIRLRDRASVDTVVWLARGLKPLGCIARFGGTSANFYRYAPEGRYGVLGIYERGLHAGDNSTVTLLTPLMIWHHAGI